jgi:hypothetical protein
MNSVVGFPTSADAYEKHEKIGFNCWRCSVKGTDVNVAIKMHNVDPALDKEKIKVLFLLPPKPITGSLCWGSSAA